MTYEETFKQNLEAIINPLGFIVDWDVIGNSGVTHRFGYGHRDARIGIEFHPKVADEAPILSSYLKVLDSKIRCYLVVQDNAKSLVVQKISKSDKDKTVKELADSYNLPIYEQAELKQLEEELKSMLKRV